MAEANEFKYVSEEMFNERTGNLTTAIATLTQRVETVIEDHEIRLRNTETDDHGIGNVKEKLGEVCRELELDGEANEQQQRQETVKLARYAITISVCGILFTVLLNISGWILKALKVI